jgi:hypothetical protein
MSRSLAEPAGCLDLCSRSKPEPTPGFGTTVKSFAGERLATQTFQRVGAIYMRVAPEKLDVASEDVLNSQMKRKREELLFRKRLACS